MKENKVEKWGKENEKGRGRGKEMGGKQEEIRKANGKERGQRKGKEMGRKEEEERKWEGKRGEERTGNGKKIGRGKDR